MFLKVKKHCGLFIAQNGLQQRQILPVTSNLLINLNHVAEVSFYPISERKVRHDPQGNECIIPAHTRVIHLQMAYPYLLDQVRHGSGEGQQVVRSYFKIYCPPEQMGQYEVLRQCIEQQVLNL